MYARVPHVYAVKNTRYARVCLRQYTTDVYIYIYIHIRVRITTDVRGRHTTTSLREQSSRCRTTIDANIRRAAPLRRYVSARSYGE